MPQVSVVIPCYKQAKFLPDAIESVLSQTLTDWECIVIDDGSPDETIDVASRYSQVDPRIRIVSQRNCGLAGARNRGIAESRGSYIQFLDADDLIAPEKLALQVSAIASSTRPSLSYSDYRYCPEDDYRRTTTRDDFAPPRFILERGLYDIASRWESEFSIPCHCFLFDARFFREYRIRFDESLPNHEDWDCWMQIFATDPDVHHVSQQLAIYRLHGSSMCVDTAKMWVGFSKAIRKQQRAFRHDPIMRNILRRKLAERRIAYNIPTSLERLHQFRKLGVAQLRRVTPWPIQRFICTIANALSKRHRNQ